MSVGERFYRFCSLPRRGWIPQPRVALRVGGKDMGNTLARTLVTGALPSVQRLRVTAIAPWPVRPEVRAVPVSMHNRRLLHGPDPPPAPTRPSGPHPPGCDDPAN